MVRVGDVGGSDGFLQGQCSVDHFGALEDAAVSGLAWR